MLIRNGTVLHNNRLEVGADLRTRGKTVAEIGRGLPGEGERVLDATGCYVLPGFIDLHTHGLQHVFVQEGGWREYGQLQLRQGVTACLPTLFGPPGVVIEAMQKGRAETDDFAATPNLLGFRLEMPYLAKPGAGQASSLVGIRDDTTEDMWASSGGKVRVWDVSPELPGAIPFICWAAQHGIVTSIAHTHASWEEARLAVDAGLSLVTHFYDTFDPPPQLDGGVYPAGLTDYIQVEDRLVAEIIPDGVHVHPFLVEMTLRCKGLDRVVFVTDSVRGAGSAPGIYSGLYEGAQVEVTADRGVRRVEDDALSGSALTQAQAFRNAVQRFGRSIPEASVLCSRTPARVLGERTKGYLSAGTDADIVVVDAALHVRATVVGGLLSYEAE
jgi:N-acetylglucosamine-6-phosphate deacetylase